MSLTRFSFRNLVSRHFYSGLNRGFSTFMDDFNTNGKTALVLGSSGCLGQAISLRLKKHHDMKVIGADITKMENNPGSNLDAFVPLPKFSQAGSIADVTLSLVQGISEVLDKDEEIDSIICASGGWAGDPPLPKPDASEEEFEKGAVEYGETINKMMEMNLYPVLAAGYAANKFMADEGATVALSATPGMLGYGLSKVGAHHFIQTLGETTGKAVTTRSRRQKARRLRKDSGYLDNLSVIGILPTTIDTPSNRDAMPKGNFDEWTNPNDIAKEIGTWIEQPPLRPHSGSLVKVHPAKNGGAAFTLVR